MKQNKRVRIYKSFEEQEEAGRKYMASLTPEERIRQAVLLIKQVYDYDNKPPLNSKRIRITRSS